MKPIIKECFDGSKFNEYWCSDCGNYIIDSTMGVAARPKTCKKCGVEIEWDPIKKRPLVSELPVGTKFKVINGDWVGLIIERNGKLYISHKHGEMDIREGDMGLDIEILPYDTSLSLQSPSTPQTPHSLNKNPLELLEAVMYGNRITGEQDQAYAELKAYLVKIAV